MLLKTALLISLLLSLPVPGRAGEPVSADWRPLPRDGLLLGSGLLLTGIGSLLDAEVRAVPAAGFSREDISPAWDRRSLTPPDPDAHDASSVLLVGSGLWPAAVTALATPGWRSQMRDRTVQAEAVFLTLGVTTLMKVLVARARPYTYFDGETRSRNPGYEADTEEAFLSFPSGHASLAWTSAASGVGILAATRPDLPWTTHFAAGAAGGGLATATALLRVEAGKHFPTDIAAGAALGAGIGIAVPLFRLEASPGTGRARKAGMAGMAAGAVVAFLLTPPTSPFYD